MSFVRRFGNILRAELPGLEGDLRRGVKQFGNAANDWLTEAEKRTFDDNCRNGNFDKGRFTETYHSEPPHASQPPAQPRGQAFSQFNDFTRVLEAGGIKPESSLKLLHIAETRGFTPQLKKWLHTTERNINTVLEPLTTLLGDRSQHETVQSEVFYRAHKLGLQQETLKWLKSRPDLTDTVGMSYRNFNLKMKQVSDSLKLPHPLNLTEEDFAFGKDFAKTISNKLQSQS
jgi:hypothetical protein